MFLSLPPATQMFHFAGFPSAPYVFGYGYMEFLHVGFPIQKSAALRIFAPPRGFSQLITSFFGSQCQGILPALFFALPRFGRIALRPEPPAHAVRFLLLGKSL